MRKLAGRSGGYALRQDQSCGGKGETGMAEGSAAKGKRGGKRGKQDSFGVCATSAAASTAESITNAVAK